MRSGIVLMGQQLNMVIMSHHGTSMGSSLALEMSASGLYGSF